MRPPQQPESEAAQVRLPEVKSYALHIPTNPLAKRKFDQQVERNIHRVQSGFPK